MEQNPSWEANTLHASHIPSILWNTCTPKAHNDSTQNQMNPVHTLPSYFCKINFDITFPSRFSKQFLAFTFPTKMYEFENCVRKIPEERSFHLLRRGSMKSGMVWFYLLSTCRMPCQSHHPWFYNPDLAYRESINLNKTSNALMYNIAARSSNHCCRGKSMSIAYSVCSLNYSACNARVPNYVYICGLWLYHIFPHYLINGTIFVNVF